MVNIETSVKKINGYLKKSSAWIVDVGTELAYVKSLASKEVYLSMFDKLPFGEKVGAKFIAIANDKYIKKYVEIVPASYNVIYDMLLADKIEDKTGLNADIVWNEIGNNVMFEGEEYDFTISGMSLNPTSTQVDIKNIFKLLKMGLAKPDELHGGVGNATGELSGWIEQEEKVKEAKKAKSSAPTTSASKSETIDDVITVGFPYPFVEKNPDLVLAYVSEVKALTQKYVDTASMPCASMNYFTYDKGVAGYLCYEDVTKSVPLSKKVISPTKKLTSKSVSEPNLSKAA